MESIRFEGTGFPAGLSVAGRFIASIVLQLKTIMMIKALTRASADVLLWGCSDHLSCLAADDYIDYDDYIDEGVEGMAVSEGGLQEAEGISVGRSF